MSTNVKNTSLLTGVVIDNSVDEFQLLKRVNYFIGEALLPYGVEKAEVISAYKKAVEVCLHNNDTSNDAVIDYLKESHNNQSLVAYISYCGEAFLEPINTSETFAF